MWRSSFLALFVLSCGGGTRTQPQASTNLAPARGASSSTAAVVVAPAVTVAKPSVPSARWPDGVDGSLPVPQRAMLLGSQAGSERLLAFTGVTSKVEHFTTAAEPGVPPAQTQEVTYYVTVNSQTGCLVHAEEFPALGRARTDQSMTVRERLLEVQSVHDELQRMHALLARFGVRTHDSVAFTPDGKNIFVESSSFISNSSDYGASFHEFGPGAAAMPVVSPSGRYAAMRHCGSPCGGLYKLTVVDLVTGTKRSLGPEDTEEIAFAPDDTLYAVRTNGGGLRKATQACVDQTTFPSWTSKRVGCKPISGLGSSSLAPNGKFLALLGSNGTNKERAYVFSLPEGKEALSFDFPAIVATGFFVGNTGRVAHTLFSSEKGEDTVWVGAALASSGAAAGWLSDTDVAVVTTYPRASDEPKPLQTLGDVGACKWLRGLSAK